MRGRSAAVRLDAVASKLGMGAQETAIYVIEIGFVDVLPVLRLIG